VACGERATLTSPVPTHDHSTKVLMVPAPESTSDQASQVISRPHEATSYAQTPSSVPTSDQGMQVLLRPPRSVAYTQTARTPTSTPTSWTQTFRAEQKDTGIDMPPVLVKSTGCQTGAYFDNEVIPPGAPRPKLPWAYTYAQFDASCQLTPTSIQGTS